MNYTFKPRQRLLNTQDYSRVFGSCNAQKAGYYFRILSVPNTFNNSRLGVIISKKNIKTAVHRNRVKRIIREFYRKEKFLVEDQTDFVVLVKRDLSHIANKKILAVLKKQFYDLKKNTKEH